MCLAHVCRGGGSSEVLVDLLLAPDTQALDYLVTPYTLRVFL